MSKKGLTIRIIILIISIWIMDVTINSHKRWFIIPYEYGWFKISCTPVNECMNILKYRDIVENTIERYYTEFGTNVSGNIEIYFMPDTLYKQTMLKTSPWFLYTAGVYTTSGQIIINNSIKSYHKTLAHEITHWAQDKDGDFISKIPKEVMAIYIGNEVYANCFPTVEITELQRKYRRYHRFKMFLVKNNKIQEYYLWSKGQNPLFETWLITNMSKFTENNRC